VKRVPGVIEVVRGGIVESRHRVHVAVADERGALVASCGEPGLEVFYRSAAKPLQALPLVEDGVVDRFGFTEEELALCCASHEGEPAHLAGARSLLAKCGLDESALRCGPQPPFAEGEAQALVSAGEAPRPIHNNCSGKHAGMLTVVRHMGWPTSGYIAPTHKVQQTILGCLEQTSGLDLGATPRGRDGCGIPVYAMSLGGLALAFARLGDPRALPPPRGAAIARIRRAMAAEPYAVGGRGRFDTALIAATGGRILSKGGAEGVACACVPEACIGIAIKIDDGAARAASVALANLLARLNLLSTSEKKKLADYLTAPISNATALTVGEVRAVAWPG
jgi:L-asparaginase II